MLSRRGNGEFLFLFSLNGEFLFLFSFLPFLVNLSSNDLLLFSIYNKRKVERVAAPAAGVVLIAWHWTVREQDRGRDLSHRGDHLQQSRR